MNEQELQEMIALLAVDALTGREREEAEMMVQERPELQEELDQLRATLGLLAEAERREPPATLRVSVLAEVARTPQTEAPAPDVQDVPGVDRTDAAEIVPITAARRRRRSSWVLAAAAALVVALAGAVVVSQFGDDGPSAQDVVTAEDAVIIPMVDPETGEPSGFSIVHSASEDAAVVSGADLAVPEGERVYEFWAIRGGVPEPIDTFRPDDEGDLAVVVDGLDPTTAEQWAISEEEARVEVPTLVVAVTPA